MYILHPDIESYLLQQVRRPHPIFAEMEKRAARLRFPIIGPLVGSVLMQLARGLNARRVLELGSGFGYSALWFACGMPEGSTILCTERSAENIRQMRENFTAAGQEKKLQVLEGDALESLGEIDGPFDLVLMDIDKKQYIEGFQKAWPKLRTGGLFLADNVLWHGKVVADPEEETTRRIIEFTRLVFARKDALTSILPLRDGVLMALKMNEGMSP